jgi:uncharacterized membrane protein YccC
MSLPTWRDWAFAFKLTVAALLALFLALWIDLPRPYWAVGTVFITSQPLAGATRSKAVYRVCGTLLGAVAAVILIPNLVNSPVLLTSAVAIWVGVCLYFSLLERTLKSYVPMLAGYTVAFIGFPAVDDPGSIFDTAVSRAEEITLGILCATFITSTVLPESVAPIVKSRLEQWFRAAGAWSIAIFSRNRAGDSLTKRLRLVNDAIGFDTLVAPLRYDMSGAQRSAEAVATLRQHMLMFLPIVSSIADRIDTLDQAQAMPKKLQKILDDMAEWLKSGTTDPLAAEQLRKNVAAIDPELGRELKWNELIVASLVRRLKDFIDLRQDGRLLQRHIVEGKPQREILVFRFTARARTIRHRDHGMAMLSALAALVAIGLSCAFWIASAWPDGASAPMMAAVACSFFAMQDNPAPQILDFGKAAIIGSIGAAVYLFAILPLATSFEMLALAFAPAVFLCGLLMTQSRTAFLGMGSGLFGFTVLALQNSYNGDDFVPFTNSAIATVMGIWTAAIVTLLMRSVGGAWSAHRLRGINRKSLVEAAARRGSSDGVELAALMLDRVGLIAPRLAAFPSDNAEWTAELLSEVRVGINIVELRRVRNDLSRQAVVGIDRILSALSHYFRSDDAHPPAGLLAPIDACLDAIAADEKEPVRRRALLGLIDLRHSLFPNVAPYRTSSTLGSELAA